MSLVDGIFAVEAKGNSQAGFDIILCRMKVPTVMYHLGDILHSVNS